MIKYLKGIDVKNKKVIVRFDYNVPVKDGIILDTKKIDETFETLDYLVGEGAKIIILSHFGRVKTEEDKKSNSLRIVFDYIKSLNKYNILFSEVNMGKMLDNMAHTLMPGQIILAENTRFLDLNGKLESSCDIQLAMYWASLADVYVDDAFGSMHRNHASVTGIPKFLPSAVGFLVERELTNLASLIDIKEKPFIVVMGGAKLEDKIELIYSLAEKADYILLGGGLANTFLKAANYNIGTSLYSEEALETASAILKEFPDKIILPKDVITSPSFNSSVHELKELSEITDDDAIGDIGSAAISNYERILASAKLVFVNGTVGKYEDLPFANGTNEILGTIAKLDAIKIVGGGDAAGAVKKFGYEKDMSFISTGGGATLSYIAEETLCGLEALESDSGDEEDIC